MISPSSMALVQECTGPALASLLAETGQRELARQLGIEHGTVGRRGSEVNNWPAGEFMAMAFANPALADAIVACLKGKKADGHGMLARNALVNLLAADAIVTGSIAKTLADGKIVKREAADNLAALTERQRIEKEEVIPSLQAVIAGKS